MCLVREEIRKLVQWGRRWPLHVRCRCKMVTFAILSPDEFLYIPVKELVVRLLLRLLVYHSWAVAQLVAFWHLQYFITRRCQGQQCFLCSVHVSWHTSLTTYVCTICFLAPSSDLIPAKVSQLTNGGVRVEYCSSFVGMYTISAEFAICT